MVQNYNSTSLYDQSAITYNSGVPLNGHFPVVGVFVAFDSGAYVGEPAWTEITTDVRNISITRGRSNDFSQFPTGTASLVLDNNARKYDPFNSSSPYNNKLTPRRQIKIVANTDTETYDIFRGYVAGWPVRWSREDTDSTVTIQCFDILGLLAEQEVSQDWSYQTISQLEPFHWWRCNDNPSSYLTDSGSAGLNLYKIVGPYDDSDFFQVDSLAPGVPYFGIALGFNQYGFVTYDTEGNTLLSANPAQPSDFSFCAWYKPGAIGAYDLNVVTFNSSQTDIFTTLTISADGCFTVTATDDSLAEVVAQAFAGSFLGENFNPCHIAVTYDKDTGEFSIYVNGVDVTDRDSVYGILYQRRTNLSYIPVEWIEISEGSYQEICIFDKTLTAQEIRDIYKAGSLLLTEDTAVRAERALNTSRIAVNLIDVTDNPNGTVSSLSVSGTSLSFLQKTSESEGGELFATKGGAVKFTNRQYTTVNSKSRNVQFILTDDITSTSTEIGYSDDIEIRYDADSLRNRITVEYTGGGRVNQETEANVEDYGIAEISISTDLSDPEEASDLATYRLGVYSPLRPTVSEISIKAGLIQDQWDLILGTELLEMFEFIRTPKSGGTVFSQKMLINQIRHEIGPERWSIGLLGSKRYVGWFALDVSELDGTDVLV